MGIKNRTNILEIVSLLIIPFNRCLIYFYTLFWLPNRS